VHDPVAPVGSCREPAGVSQWLCAYGQRRLSWWRTSGRSKT